MRVVNVEGLRIRIDTLAGIIAELDEENRDALPTALDLINDLLNTPSIPEERHELLTEIYHTVKKLDSDENGFAENYSPLCDMLNRLGREVDAESDEGVDAASSAVGNSADGAKDAGAHDPFPEELLTEEDAPREPHVPGPMSAADVEEMDLQLDMLMALMMELDEGNVDLIGAIGGLFDKISKIATLPESKVLLSEYARGLADKLRRGEDDFDETYKLLTAAVEKLVVLKNAEMNPVSDDSSHEESESMAAAGRVTIEPEKPAEMINTGDALPAASVVNIDLNNPELLDFVTESNENLHSAEVALIRLEKEPGDRESINEIFRCFHNIKGISGCLNLIDVQQLSHNAESLMGGAREGRLEFDGRVAAAAFAALDMLKDMVRRVKAAFETAGKAGYQTPHGFEELLLSLKDAGIIDGKSGTAAAGKPPPAPALTQAFTAHPMPVDEKSNLIAGSEQKTRTAPDAFVKVNTVRLDNLIDAVGELVIANAMVTQEPVIAETLNTRLAGNVSLLSKITRELQELAMSMRMVSLKSTFNKMARVARDLAVKSGAPVDFSFSGEDTELDRNVVEEISSPLVHMVRNAIDHGLEPPDERLRVGKAEKGNVHLCAYHEAGNVVITISDDGKGLEGNAILEKAKASGLVSPDEELTEREVYQLIFHAGFSTAKAITDVSGRGVGMDVVKRAIETLRGRVEIDSKPGEGATFTIKLPLTMAIIDGMLVRVADERYIVPTIAIQESLRPRPDQLSTVVNKGEMVDLRGAQLPLFRLHRIFKIQGAIEDPTQALTLVIGENGGKYALMVDDLIGQQQVVIKSLGGAFAGLDGVCGGAIMGDGKVSLILEPSRLAKMAAGKY